MHSSYQKNNQPNSQNDVIDVKADVIPIYNDTHNTKPPNKLKLGYDIVMVVAILVDLAVIFFDQIMMSTFVHQLAIWLDWAAALDLYRADMHRQIAVSGGFFTLFLIVELLIRWVIAIKNNTYYRWFFFPFVHWYEVLGCFVLLRPLRLLRAIIIIKRLHDMNIQIVPTRWIKTAKFYGHIAMEELSDRVLLTAMDNFRMQLSQSKTHKGLIQQTINKNRTHVYHALLGVLRRELVPRLKQINQNGKSQELSYDIGHAVERALINTPELRRYLKLIPIAGALIEAQVVDIGRHIGQNITLSVNDSLLSDKLLDDLMVQIAKSVSQIDLSSPDIERLFSDITNDAINAFEQQIKAQQWKHTEHLPI